MGTVFSIDLYGPDEAEAGRVMEQAFDEVDRLELLLSNYRPSSELSRIGREAARGAVTTDPETFRFLERSLFWSRQSSGAFDITVGPLLRAWGFFEHGGRIPSDAELRVLRAQVGWKNIQLNPIDRSVLFPSHRPMELDPGSIGKGFAVDAMVSLLRELRVGSAIISAGQSTIYAIGSPPGASGWPIDIPDPRTPGALAGTATLRDESLSSGACTQKFFIRDGHRYCHIFNPRTMRPVEGVLQTTVIAPSATDSDALSTVVFVLPPASSRALLEPMRQTRALLFRDPHSPLRDASPDCIAIHWAGHPCVHSDPSP